MKHFFFSSCVTNNVGLLLFLIILLIIFYVVLISVIKILIVIFYIDFIISLLVTFITESYILISCLIHLHHPLLHTKRYMFAGSFWMEIKSFIYVHFGVMIISLFMSLMAGTCGLVKVSFK